MAKALESPWQKFKREHPIMKRRKTFNSDVSAQRAEFDRERDALLELQ